ARDRPLRVRLHDQPGRVRDLPPEGNARRGVREDRQADAGGDEGQDLRRRARRARHRVRRANLHARAVRARAMRAPPPPLLVILTVARAGPPPAPAPKATRDDLYVLLPAPAGTAGALSVTQGAAPQVLDAPYAAARIRDAGRIEVGTSTPEEVARVFGVALSA